jgi:hypothetical protein
MAVSCMKYLEQDVAPAKEYFPLSQSLQVLCPVDMYVPAWHSLHEDAVTTDVFPESQTLQDVASAEE